MYAKLEVMNYSQLTIQELIGEMLQLQYNCDWLKHQADKASEQANDPVQLHYWYDCLKELHLMGQDARLVADILNMRWRGYV